MGLPAGVPSGVQAWRRAISGQRKREMRVHATPSLSLSFSLTVQRERERARERERGRESERERGREEKREFFKGMTGALAPFSYLVFI